jgi:GNAT superfamily N-acetyltransferase
MLSPAPTDPQHLTMRFCSPFDAHDRAALRELIVRSHARHQDRPRQWDYVVSTLGLWDHARLIGYVQFGTGPGVTYQYGMRVDPAERGQGFGRRLFAEWLRVARACGAVQAIGCVAPANDTTRMLFKLAHFEPMGIIHALPVDEELYVGGEPAFQWACAHPREEWATWD